MGRASAHGKVILAGEHFVVHGTAAIAVPVGSRGVTVSIERTPGDWRVPDGVEEHLKACLKHLGEAPEKLTVEVETSLPVGAGLGGSAVRADEIEVFGDSGIWAVPLFIAREYVAAGPRATAVIDSTIGTV